MASFILTSLIFLTFSLPSFSLYSPLLPSTSPSLRPAIESLISSNHLSMSLTLQLVSPSLLSTSNSLTIFAPLDSSFVDQGQPSLSLLKSHISPMRVPIDELKNLPRGTTLSTLSSVSKLVVTSSFLDGNLTINNVGVQDYAFYDDGSVIIYGIDEFFNTSSLILPVVDPRIAPVSSYRGPKLSGLSGFGQISSGFNPATPFSAAVGLLRLREYKKMAAFLDMQLGFEGEKLTVFAPPDQGINENGVSIENYSQFFRGHVVRGLFKLMDLMMIKDETLLETYSEDGFKITVTKSGDIVVVNGVPLIFADIYCTDWLVIHGLNQAILPLGTQEIKESVKESESSAHSDYEVEFEDNQASDYPDLHQVKGVSLKKSFRRDYINSEFGHAEAYGNSDFSRVDYDLEFVDDPSEFSYFDEQIKG